MSTALYRRYRPDTFADVIGQEHVTGPLMQALRTGRVNHAYLFSGPRGCGKTTSARILARTLNCHRNTPEHPVDTPCGECPSCVDLARGGPGSLDVVEIDAASHGGVDDARELRERATFAPTRDRYKIFILDEAHMVTSAGFNALLKIVEEPPEHVRFVFATTEPEKVIGTIRSRTHHYPFRLVPPDVLQPYLEQLCTAEGVQVGGGVLPLVVRAGGGSVRDTLSVLDQLVAGAVEVPDDGSGPAGTRGRVLEYEQAVALLGFTHANLLDDVVDALAARDGASLFRVVERVVASGHEPRRFVEDVLERLRDLVVLAVADGEAVAALAGLPSDQLERMRAQAAALGLGELSRAADLANAALTEMTGATSPRLHLELLCARLLLPGADDGAAGFAARLDRLERGGLVGGLGAFARAPRATPAADDARPEDDESAPVRRRPSAPAGDEQPAPARRHPSLTPVTPAAVDPVAVDPVIVDPVAVPPAPVGTADDTPGTDDDGAGPDLDAPAAETTGSDGAAADPDAAARDAGSVGTQDRVDGDAEDSGAEGRVPDAAPTGTRQSAAAAGSNVAHVESELVRRRWDEVLETLFRLNKSTWSLVKQNATVAALDGNVLTLSFQSAGLQGALVGSKAKVEALEKAVYETLGFPVKIAAVVGSAGVGPAAARPRENRPSASDGDGSSDDAPADRAGSTDAGTVRASDDAAWLAGDRRPSAAPGAAPAGGGAPEGETPRSAEPETIDGPARDGARTTAAVGASAAASQGGASGSLASADGYDDVPPAEPPHDVDDLPPWDDDPGPARRPSSPVATAPADPPPTGPAGPSAPVAPSAPPAPSASPAPTAPVVAARPGRPSQAGGAPNSPSGGPGGPGSRRGGPIPPDLVGPPLVAHMLGGVVIEEVVDQPD